MPLIYAALVGLVKCIAFFAIRNLKMFCVMVMQEEFQLAIFKNRKKENLFANRVKYILSKVSASDFHWI